MAKTKTITNEKTERINKLKTRITDLKKIMAADTNASYKEASQTEDMIQVFEKQLLELVSIPQTNKVTTYILKDESGKKQTYFLAKANPDPFRNIISEQSPLGKKLKAAKLNDVLEHNKQRYKIFEIKE